MEHSSKTRWDTSNIAAAIVLLLGVSVLVGWMIDVEFLKRVASDYVTMNPLTSVCFVAAAIALYLARGSKAQREASRIISALLLVTATWQLIADLSEASIQPDEILFPVRVDETVPLSRMAPSTAVGFILGSIAIALIQSDDAARRSYGQYFGLALGTVALFSGVAYTYGAGTHAILRPFNLMAIHTSWGLFVLSIGILFKDPRVGVISLIMSKDMAGQQLRLMIPAIVIVPTILGWFTIRAEQAGFFGTALAVTMLATFSIILLFVLTIATAMQIRETDTERQRRMKTVRASEERLAGILSIAADAIISTDANQNITLFNEWAEKIFGYAREDVLGKPLGLLLPERLRDWHAQQVSKFGEGTTRARRMGETGLIIARKKDGLTFPAEASISKLSTDEGMIYTVVLRDITEKQRAEVALIKAKNEAEAAARSQSEFLANMSHEIRTPLNSIAGFTQLLLTNDALEGDLRAQVRKIKNSAIALTTVVNDILDYSKLEEGMLTLSMGAIAPAQVAHDCVSIVTPAADARSLSIKVEIAPTVSDNYYLGDANRLQQILLNLLSNAVKFTEKGTITVKVSEQDSDTDCARVHFEVIDTGIGIKPDSMGRLFRRFSQVDGSSSRHYGGTGLGLAICKRIVNLMGGEIGAESEPGKGSTFWFQLPMERTASPVRSKKGRRKARDKDAAQRQILLVEDIELNREIAVAMLEQAGHAVDIACDGAQAVSKVADRHYDLILMDIQMPTMDGITATRLIRSLDGINRGVPIIAMTANVLPDEVTRFHEAGMNGHIRKPVELDELIAQVAHWTSETDQRASA